jgi:uncharacterized membrane protein HdeD (DUF308 family)
MSILIGVLIAAIGLFMIGYPMAAATVTVIFLGWSLLFAGVGQIVFAFQSRKAGHLFVKIAVGLLYALTGVALLVYPIAGVAALTLTLGSLLLVQAAMLIASAFMLRPAIGWGWFLADGIAALAIGLLIIAGWPSSSYWAIGTLLGVSVLMTGIARIFIATKIRSDLQHLAPGTT